MAIGETFKPYVHSNIYNFHRQLNENLDEESIPVKNRFTKDIKDLEALRNRLKIEADAFLGNQSVEQVMNNLKEEDKIFFRIARKILEERTTAEIILNGDTSKQIAAAVRASFKNLDSNIMQVIQNSTNIDEIASIIATEIFKEMIGKSGKEQQKIFSSFIRNSKKIEDKASFKIIKKLSSDQGKIKKLVKQRLNESMEKQRNTRRKSTDAEKFCVYFEKRFYDILKSENVFFEKGEEKKFLNTFTSKVKNELNQNIFNYKNINNIYGVFTEDFFQITLESLPSNQLEITVIGKESEEEIIKKYNNLVRKMMTTHHDTKKMSGTDILLTNPTTNRTVRVQSKNLATAYQSFLSGKTIPGAISMEKEIKYKDLIGRLESTNTLKLTQEDLRDISYLLANEIWFRARGSYEEEDGRKISKQASGLQYSHSIVEKIFSKQIANFIGASIDDAINVNDNRASGSNIFYLIAGHALVPTYKIVDDIIKNLKQEEEKIANLKVYLKTTGYNLSRAKDFYDRKLKAVRNFDSEGNYSSPALLEVGTSEGSGIIDKLTFSSIGLRVDFDKILKSSMSF